MPVKRSIVIDESPSSCGRERSRALHLISTGKQDRHSHPPIADSGHGRDGKFAESVSVSRGINPLASHPTIFAWAGNTLCLPDHPFST